MGSWQGIRLEGDLVILEPLAREHEEGLWRASRDPRTWEFLPILQPSTRPEIRELLEAALDQAARGLEIPFAAVWKGTGEVIGSTRYLALHPEWLSLEIGWTWLAPSAWETGANIEAKLLQLGDAFDRLGCRRVELKTDARNGRSRAAIAALPAQFEGVHRQHMLVRGGENRDSAWYSILDSEWPLVRDRLRERLRAK